MSLELKHKQLAVYKIASNLVSECYRLTMKLPAEERFCLVQQIRRAAVSVILNIAEGSSRKSELERKRFFELSRGSLTEVDTALDLCVLIGHLKKRRR